jgi:hypothetical protein
MINHDKAYILGLFIGNGTIANDTFIIKLPFKKWGMNPTKMNDIARDILTKISDKFFRSYNFQVNYEIGNSEWIIKPIDNSDITQIKNDLTSFGLPSEGFLLKNTNLSLAKSKLKRINLENFLSGIFDTRCSLAKSHRRFTDEAPIVSLEIPGSTENFKFVSDFCSWLTDLGTITDQILYNHPNQHSASDPSYKGWKKGFKIRFLVGSFLAKHSFVLKAKAVDIDKLKIFQAKSEQVPCINRKIRKPSPVCIHSEIDSNTLPTIVRNKLFFHYHHYCAVLGCQYAPIDEIKSIVSNYKEYIFVLPRMEKGVIQEIKNVFLKISNKYLLGNKTILHDVMVCDVINNDEMKKYHELEQGIAYLFSQKLNGKRHSGSKDTILSENSTSQFKIYSIEKTHLSPLLMINELNDRAVIISAIQSQLNQELIDKHICINNLEVKII